jgi:hypothetical protein
MSDGAEGGRLTTPDLNEDFRDLLEAFVLEGVDFVIVGAHALAVHGVPRATGDLDVLVRAGDANAARVLRALATFGAPVEQHGLTAADFAREGNVYQMGQPPRRIDVLTSIDGVDFDTVARGRVVARLEGLDLPVIGLRELRTNKRAAGRTKDLLDLALLDEAGRGGVDEG